MPFVVSVGMPLLLLKHVSVVCRICLLGASVLTIALVIALDTSPTRLALARHNAQIYGVADRIEFILTDYISFVNSHLSLPQTTSTRKIDVVFLSPPWGGPSYLSGVISTDASNTPVEEISPAPTPIELHPSYSLSSIQPIHGADLFRLTRRITPNVAYYLPRNTQLEEISSLLDSSTESSTSNVPDATKSNTKLAEFGGEKKREREEPEKVEVEEEWMGSKLKALTCYFGGLVVGQDSLF